MKKETIAILGDGAWGTAMATVLAENGHTVHLWCYNQSVANTIMKTHSNPRFLPGIIVPENIVASTQLSDVVSGAQYIFQAIPTKYLRGILAQVQPLYTKDQTWIILSKGIEQETCMFPLEILQNVFNTAVQAAIIAGPSFAQQLAQKQFTAVNIYATDQEVVKKIISLCSTSYFSLYPLDDAIGIQVSGALKNVIALAIGMLEGAGYHDNTKAFVFTCGLQEIMRVIQVLGGNQQSTYALCGVGDVLLTSFGQESKNRRFGFLLGQGKSAQELLQNEQLSCEGVNTVVSILSLVHRYSLNVPLSTAVHDIIYKSYPIKKLIEVLQ